MSNLRYFASFLLVVTLQTICDTKATPGPLNDGNDFYNSFGLPGRSSSNFLFDDMFKNGLNNRATTSRIIPISDDPFLIRKPLFNSASPLSRTASFSKTSSSFPSNFPFSESNVFPKRTLLDPISSTGAMPHFSSAFERKPSTDPNKNFGSFNSFSPVRHSSESDSSSSSSRQNTNTRNFKSVTTTHVFIRPYSSSNPPLSPKPTSPPVAIKDHSDESSSDDSSKKLSRSLKNSAPLAAAAAGVALGSALTKKPPQTQIQPPVAAAPNSAIAQQSKNDEDKCNWCLRKNCNPGGCQEVANFNATKDAETLNDALKKNNERIVIDILTHRSDKQIKRIKEKYQVYKTSLKTDIENSSFKSKKLLESLLLPRALFFAKELHKAFKKGSGDDEAMTSILTSLSPCAVQKIGDAYNLRYDKTLVEDIKGASTLYYENFLVELSRGNRNPDGPVDKVAAENDAKELFAAGPKRLFTSDKKVFIDILTNRPNSQLLEIFKIYSQLSKKSNIVKDIEDNTSGKLQAGLLAVVRNVQDQPGYFADELEGSLEKLIGNGVANENMLIRIMRGRCGIDLGDIRDAYPRNHDGKNLVDKIKGKSDIEDKEVLLAMLT